ncbi:uncharacterized protein LOC143203631 isoform X4 [Rhynchophorus ferrugineus]|uniref:uncharacterized protein LOC143203631 isoform X4 n=1 Tax=Rhynchophorus ferrugineus TaxID=354439 RepID=UPI003FCD2AB5
MTSAKVLFVLVALFGVALCYQAGQYVPKSFYIIDQFGRKSDLVYVRNRRDIMEPLLRIRRAGGYASASSHASASASASSGSGGGGGQYYGGAPQAFAGASSSSNAGVGGYGPASGQSYGGLGSGHDAGYNGPILFSRFGEAEGSGIHVSGQAAGPNAAFSSSSSSVDSDGKIKYSVQSGKY